MACRGPVRLVVAAALVAVAASAHAADGERPGGLYGAGQALPVVSSAVELHVAGPFVEGRVVQRFKNPFDRAIEAVYVFPLPDDAAVSAMSVRTGDRTIVARIEDRGAARRRYEAAVAAGTAGALLEEERGDVFTQAVTAIPAHGEVAIELRWDGEVGFHAHAWQLTVPLVVGPRAVPGRATGRPSAGTGAAPDTDRAPDASRVTPERGVGVPTTVALRIDGAGATGVEVLSHDAKVTTDGAGADIAIADVSSDRDLRVQWQIRGEPLAALTDADGFVAMLVPAPERAATAPRDWIVIADTAARLDGDSLVLVKRALRALAAQLGPRDRITILDGTGASQVARGGAAAARAWIDRVRASGASDLPAAIAVATAKAGPDVAVVLVSDGLVADDAAVLAAAGAARLSAIGVGPAPNHALLDGLAARTGGVARYLAVADESEPIARAIATAARPAIAIDWGGLAVDQVPAVLPAMAPGDAIVVIARATAPRAATVRAAGQALTLPAVWASSARPAADAVSSARLLGRRWARAKIEALVAAGGHADEIRALGLGFGLVTPVTALVAVGQDTVVRGGVATSVAVPVAQPAGMRWQFAFRDADVDGTIVDTKLVTPDLDATHAGTGTRKPTGGGSGGGRRPDEPRAPVAQPQPTDGREATGSGGDIGGADAGEDDAESEVRNAPPAPVATSGEADSYRAEASEVVSLSGSASQRWRGALSIGAGGLLTPEREVALAISARIEQRLTPRTAIGLETALLVAPTADHRVAVSVLATALRSLAHGGFALEFGLGAQLGADSGLGYAIAARVGRRVGLVLRWDGAVLSTEQGADHRAQVTGGVELGF
ncbi:MAG: hypothetical protein K8W52_15225 [Deltaproteobacteria bacterium]|nr:hypothetical protein [Deltaproteobacteria bacterium]